jgi:hypothetical protein
VWAQQATPAQMDALNDAAARLEGGSAEFTPAGVQEAYGQAVTKGVVYSLPMDTFVAFRADVWAGIVAGDLGRTVGNKGAKVVDVVGHEGVHLLNGTDKQARSVKWSFRP